jgi:hypothetical protein
VRLSNFGRGLEKVARTYSDVTETIGDVPGAWAGVHPSAALDESAGARLSDSRHFEIEREVKL